MILALWCIYVCECVFMCVCVRACVCMCVLVCAWKRRQECVFSKSMFTVIWRRSENMFSMLPIQRKRSKNVCFANPCHQCFEKAQKIICFQYPSHRCTEKGRKYDFFSNRCQQFIEKGQRIREAYFKAYDFRFFETHLTEN